MKPMSAAIFRLTKEKEMKSVDFISLVIPAGFKPTTF